MLILEASTEPMTRPVIRIVHSRTPKQGTVLTKRQGQAVTTASATSMQAAALPNAANHHR